MSLMVLNCDNKMNKILFLFFSVFFIGSAHAQKVTNIRAEQRGQDIIVFYSLETTSTCFVSLVLSQDNGATWGAPLKNISGDNGRNVNGGEKQILWKVLDEGNQLEGDQLKFKVVAIEKKPFEPDLIFVEGGAFEMGEGDDTTYHFGGNGPKHSVTLSSFYISKYEVTQSQWLAIMGNNPSYFSGCENCPVENVSWYEVQEFIRKLNLRTNLFYRLPTEAEWEFAAKGGIKSKGYKYSGSDDYTEVAWLHFYSYNDNQMLNPVGKKKPNELGICDMNGNVEEWCSDWLGPYSMRYEVNPQGPLNGSLKILRGGCSDGSIAHWNILRSFDPPSVKHRLRGFRLILPVE